MCRPITLILINNFDYRNSIIIFIWASWQLDREMATENYIRLSQYSIFVEQITLQITNYTRIYPTLSINAHVIGPPVPSFSFSSLRTNIPERSKSGQNRGSNARPQACQSHAQIGFHCFGLFRPFKTISFILRNSLVNIKAYK